MKLILNSQFHLYEKDGRAYCDSLQVAEAFEKRHDNVLRDIQELDCSDGFNLLNFEETHYKDDMGRRQPRILMTKDGFVFLVMGYRGKRAARFKEEYISRFNQMEELIRSLCTVRQDFPAFTETIKNAHDSPKPHHYTSETNMIYQIALGTDAKGYPKANGLAKGTPTRPHLTLDQIQAIEALQRMDIGLIAAGLSYDRRKDILAAKHSHVQELAS